VRLVHGSTVDRPLKTKGYAIQSVRARSNGPGRTQVMGSGDIAGERRRATEVRRRWPWTAFPATSPTTGLVQNDAGTLAHVTGGSMGSIVPHRRPAPEGGGADTPVSSRVRYCARKEGKSGGGYCSQFKGVAGELEGVEDATTTKLGNGGGSGSAPVWSRRGSHGLWGQEPAANRA
jgi:hypothetical protein